MTVDDIRKYVHEQPFRPFRVHLSDGRAVVVGHPDFIALPPPDNRATMITVYEDRFARHIYIRNITSIDVERPVEGKVPPAEPPDKQSGNGSDGNGRP
jgi:hypothetical protein